MYRVVRVNTSDHNTQLAALNDMAWIIEQGYYWKKSGEVSMPIGTPVVAMGSYSGAGLFLFGISSGEWEEQPTDGGHYHLRIPMQWQPVIYSYNERLPNQRAVNDVAAMLHRFNIRFGAEATKDEFANVLSYVIRKCEVLVPYSWAEAA